jgi:hypothetical protein
MSIGEATGLVAALMAMMLGLVGSVLPILPSAPLIFLAALAHKLCLQERSVGWWVVLVLGGFTGLTLLLDFASSIYGAKRFGATWRGIIGAGLGAIVGILVFPPLGIDRGALDWCHAGGIDWRTWFSRGGPGGIWGGTWYSRRVGWEDGNLSGHGRSLGRGTAIPRLYRGVMDYGFKLVLETKLWHQRAPHGTNSDSLQT